ncbi:pannexin-1, partial [Ictalurus punctatus]|uniref:Pannexin-1 n=1 Tax=Ictalurus punctatus TaxID=7998 RepID=A0A9F7TH53_ICTPU
KDTWALAWKYLLFLLLTLSTLILACSCLLYYIFKVSQIDHFSCELHTGVVLNRSAYPPVPCKLVSVGVFQVFSCINVFVYTILLVLVVIHATCPCARQRQQRQLLKPYERLPAFVCAQGLSDSSSRFDDLSIYLLFLEENPSELKSFKYVQQFLKNSKQTSTKQHAMVKDIEITLSQGGYFCPVFEFRSSLRLKS